MEVERIHGEREGLVYAIPRDAVRLTRRGVVRLPVEAMAARAAWLVGALPHHDADT
jgi:hypothetical protein